MADNFPTDMPQDDPSKPVAGKLGGIISRLQAMATKRVGERQSLEDEWILSASQYHGKYDEKTLQKLIAAKKSQLFINETRPKTDAMSARLMDLLFPTDDKNWGINPTPVPTLTKAAQEAEKAALDLSNRLAEAQAKANLPEGQEPDPALKQLMDQADAAKKNAEALQVKITEGKRRCELMEAEIDDQLKESNYHEIKRDQIEDACKYGTGVTKGPITGMKVRKGWKLEKVPVNNPDGTPKIGPDGQPVTQDGGYKLQMSDGERPSMVHVDLWSFFPDMDVKNIKDGEGNLERHLMNDKKLRGLARLKGFDKDAIRRLLLTKPKVAPPSYLTNLRNVSGDKQTITGQLYHVWEYSGPLTTDDMMELALAVGDEATVKEMTQVDPLTELNAVVWFCDGELLKFSIYPYDSGECMYSVFNLYKDDSSIFGYGMPQVIRDPQKALNASWRAMMDNGGLASGPQVVIAKSLIQPADGDWTMTPGKVWIAQEGLPQNHRAFETFSVDMHQVQLANIITLSKQFIDDMSSMPQIAQGEQGTGVTKTAQGMALLMNSANVVFRRIVKNFDDDVTTPDIRRLYDWNMQFSDKDEIKGDFDVDARGSSVLLVREMQAQTLMSIATNLGGHPVYGPMLNNRGVLKGLFKALMISTGDVMLSDNEIDAVLAAAANDSAVAEQQKRQQELEDRKLDIMEQQIGADISKANMQNEADKDIALIKRETELIKLAQTGNMSLDQLEGRLQMHREKLASDERKFAAEIAVEQRNAEEARGRGEQPTGSGGFISMGAGDKPPKQPSAGA